MTANDPLQPFTTLNFLESRHGLNILSASSRTQWPRLAALFAGLSVIAVFALIELQHSSYIERLDAFIQEQVTDAARSDEPLKFPRYSGLGGDRLSMIVALAGSLLALAAVYFGVRSWAVRGQSKLHLFLSRYSVLCGALSLLMIGVISSGFAWHDSSPLAVLSSAEQTLIEKCLAPDSNQNCPTSSSIRPVPYFVNGDLKGYRVYPGSDSDVFDAAGLKFGDLITEIEGQPLTDIELVSRLRDSISNGRPVQVTVEREGVSKEIELQTD